MTSQLETVHEDMIAECKEHDNNMTSWHRENINLFAEKLKTGGELTEYEAFILRNSWETIVHG